ncbi:MAG: quinone-dependent dihydroorotate dehydrogenase [Thermoanaerobaculia bacterium]|nr:quinone-dependent dihydroorotate dehydrogenase [Thermoanaerobaculia bacterium]
MIYEVAKALLFHLDAEAAHDLVTRQMARAQSVPLLLRAVRRAMFASCAPRELWGLRFANPFGIAAGFDKNAELIPMLTALGFGFVEVGTVTLLPQPGNPKPRMFRYPEHEALVNRLGFNNEGAAAAAERLAYHWASLSEEDLAGHPPVLVNIGKNKEVGLEDAAENYVRTYELLAPLADGVVVNVSSPNTASLRDLQRPEHLELILSALREARARARFEREAGDHPIIVKIAPDLDDTQLGEICELATRMADGLTATNTTIDRSRLPVGAVETGGISGRPVFEPSTRVLREVRRRVGSAYPVVGVGGVMGPADALEKLRAGADLVQGYTGFVYRGPSFARDVVRGLSEGGEA